MGNQFFAFDNSNVVAIILLIIFSQGYCQLYFYGSNDIMKLTLVEWSDANAGVIVCLAILNIIFYVFLCCTSNKCPRSINFLIFCFALHSLFGFIWNIIGSILYDKYYRSRCTSETCNTKMILALTYGYLLALEEAIIVISVIVRENNLDDNHERLLGWIFYNWFWLDF